MGYSFLLIIGHSDPWKFSQYLREFKVQNISFIPSAPIKSAKCWPAMTACFGRDLESVMEDLCRNKRRHDLNSKLFYTWTIEPATSFPGSFIPREPDDERAWGRGSRTGSCRFQLFSCKPVGWMCGTPPILQFVIRSQNEETKQHEHYPPLWSCSKEAE